MDAGTFFPQTAGKLGSPLYDWMLVRVSHRLPGTLSHLLSDSSALFFPVVVESDFVKYESKFENHMSGSIRTAVGKVKLNVGGRGLVEGRSSFGTLRKQEVDLQQLIQDAVGR